MAYTTIPAHGESDGWNFIASPLTANTDPTTVENMIISTEYDLYRFNQSANMEWQNYKAHTDDFVLENGQGYLYANAEDVNIIFKGDFNEDETKEISLVYDANADFAGWNLVGNPFPVSAYADRSYYVMNEDGTAIEPVPVSMETAILVCTGVMVKADNQGETVVFSKDAPESVSNQGNLQITVARDNLRGNAMQDKVIVSFNEGDRLEKFVFNEGNARISIPQGGKEFAIACAEKSGELPLNFEATKNGQYTLSINSNAVELEYLHLIDNMTGADVDLLTPPAFGHPLCEGEAQSGAKLGETTAAGRFPPLRGGQGESKQASYTFTAQTTDYASRFKLVFSVSGNADGDDAPFAFISNGNIIIIGADAHAMLQIVDVTGRVLVCTNAASHISTSGMAKGVYVLRLIEGDKVRTQKIVVR
jgi:hypothetical protein